MLACVSLVYNTNIPLHLSKLAHLVFLLHLNQKLMTELCYSLVNIHIAMDTKVDINKKKLGEKKSI